MSLRETRLIRFGIFLAALLVACLTCEAQQKKTVRIVLAGDSTVTDDAGWGKGFAELLNDQAQCINMAKGGRSSRSYRAEGWWKESMLAKPDYLLIQFGHNDQPGKGVERESDPKTDFPEHLRQYVQEAKQAGVQPVLITSLTRRRWTDNGKILPTLAEYAQATLKVAQELNVPAIDLHRLSIEQCELIGPIAFRAFEPMDEKGADHTHLNHEGSRAVAPLVAKKMIELLPETAELFSKDRITANTVPMQYVSHLSGGGLQLDENESAIELRIDGRHLLTYNKQSPPVPDGMDQAYQRSGFLHPVSSPDGLVVTTTFPIDHAHQHGIFSAWVKTRWMDRELDFWNLAKKSARVLHQRVNQTFLTRGTVGFEVDLIHQAASDPQVDILRERWTITARKVSKAHFQFDLHTVQTALTKQPLHIEKYHYGGVAYRGPVNWLTQKDEVAKKAAADGIKMDPFEFTNDQGHQRVEGNAEHTKWVVATGQIDGRTVSIVTMCHSHNFRAPQAARLHPTKPYFAYSPCIDDAFVIDKNHPYEAKYRYLVLDSQPEESWIASQWEAWHAE
ncbi:MAG: DUF6807 family protein [Pirellulales bacterium]